MRNWIHLSFCRIFTDYHCVPASVIQSKGRDFRFVFDSASMRFGNTKVREMEESLGPFIPLTLLNRNDLIPGLSSTDSVTLKVGFPSNLLRSISPLSS